MSPLLRSELLKVWTTRAWWAYPAAVVLFGGGAVAGEIGSAESARRSTLELQVSLVEAIGIAGVLAVLLGITLVTTEFRHGTVTPTFLAAPSRERVLGAKAAAGVAAATGLALLGAVVVAAVALPWLALVDARTHLGDGELWGRLGQQLLLAVLGALMGVAIGAAVHNQVAALVGTLLWLFLGETLLTGLFGLLDVNGLSAYLPFRALDAAGGTGADELLSYGAGVAVSLGWIALLGGAGTLRTVRRDIT